MVIRFYSTFDDYDFPSVEDIEDEWPLDEASEEWNEWWDNHTYSQPLNLRADRLRRAQSWDAVTFKDAA